MLDTKAGRLDGVGDIVPDDVEVILREATCCPLNPKVS